MGVVVGGVVGEGSELPVVSLSSTHMCGNSQGRYTLEEFRLADKKRCRG